MSEAIKLPENSLGRLLAAVLWPSFLAAAVATFVFFANIDPESLRAATFPEWEIGRRTGYTIGFFMFWAVTAFSSALTLFLFRPVAPARRRNVAANDQ
ncbi:hypothetical protein H0Z60_07300 [Ectothiorhodospiraceae bacterium WFHF3C12]|nr:hypothetical protein [Ectothiorhodospiraceae bacterium WFHF3C12]